MGVEPTAACSAQPATGVEDQGIHRDTTTPTMFISLTHLSATPKLQGFSVVLFSLAFPHLREGRLCEGRSPLLPTTKMDSRLRGNDKLTTEKPWLR